MATQEFTVKDVRDRYGDLFVLAVCTLAVILFALGVIN